MTGVWQTVAKYRLVFTICVAERLTYRTDFFLGTLMRFLPIITTIFLWTAIFEGSSYSEIAGFTRDGVVAYYLLVMISRAFSSMPGLASGLARDVRDGHVKKYLTQPIDLLAFQLTSRVAHKLVYYGLAFLPFFLVYYLCRGFFDGWPPVEVMVAYVLSLFLGFFIGFLIEMLIGLLSFWFLEISSFSFVFMTLNYVISGHMFPLDLVPEPWVSVLKALPFQYLAYFPATVFLRGEAWGSARLWTEIAVQAGWALGLFLLVRFAYARGVRHYSAFGG